MKNWLALGFSTIIGLMSVGCSGLNQFVEGTIYDATLQIAVAKEVDAAELASQELADAEQMLAQAEIALKKGEQNQAYRFGMRAYLKARLAEAIAIMNRKEGLAATATRKLEVQVKAVEAARRTFENAKDEFERVKSTPP